MLSKTKNKRREDNDCCIIAIADHFSIPYRDAKAVCEFHGKKPHSGMELRLFLNAITEFVDKSDIKTITPTGLVVSDVPDMMNNGFIMTNNHVMQIKHGVITNNIRDKFGNTLVELLIEI
jgi:hypothetical protein